MQTNQTLPPLRLTVERQRLGLTKRELAQRAGLDQGLLSKLELRRMAAYPGWLAKLARALKVPKREAAPRLVASRRQY